jgi:hypothetical protein
VYFYVSIWRVYEGNKSGCYLSLQLRINFKEAVKFAISRHGAKNVLRVHDVGPGNIISNAMMQAKNQPLTARIKCYLTKLSDAIDHY